MKKFSLVTLMMVVLSVVNPMAFGGEGKEKGDTKSERTVSSDKKKAEVEEDDAEPRRPFHFQGGKLDNRY
ncbi:MAG: hypothetical protein AB1540_07615 [Bdellovibrionota bacterium]